MSKTTVTIPNAALVGIANLVHFTPVKKSDRDMTPILAMVQVTLTPASGDNWELVAIATDRYMVGRYTVELDGTKHGVADLGDKFSFLLPLDLLKSLKPTLRESSDWTITVTPDPDTEHWHAHRPSTVTFNNGTRSLSGLVIGGNFPRVDRLIPEPDARVDLAPLYALNAAHLARLSKIALPTTLEPIWHLQGTATDHPSKPGPVVWSLTVSDVEHYTVLQQPNLIR